MKTITKEQIRRRIETAVEWEHISEPYRFGNGTTGVDEQHNASFRGLALEVSAPSWREGVEWFTWGTGKDPCPEGKCDTVDEAKAAAINAAVEHFAEVLEFFGIPVVHRWLTIETPGRVTILTIKTIRQTLGLGLKEAHNCVRGLLALPLTKPEHDQLATALTNLGARHTFHTEELTVG